MRSFIDAKLRQVLSDFDQSAAQAKGLCACKGLTYASGHTPKYSDPLVQQIYMLRYFPAYLVEYYLMYQQLLWTNFMSGKFKILSIGCGCGVDLWGLYFALRKQGGDCAALIDYTGIDLAPWQYFDDLGLPTARFIRRDITSLNRLKRSDYNVVVFPKCIGEFPPGVFNKICDIIKQSLFQENRVCGLCSLMDKGCSYDETRFSRVAQTLQTTHGFELLDENDTHWHVPKKCGLKAICKGFDYPEDILNSVKANLDKCQTNTANGHSCEKDCDEQLNKSPILTTSYVKYQMLRFERPAPSA